MIVPELYLTLHAVEHDELVARTAHPAAPTAHRAAPAAPTARRAARRPAARAARVLRGAVGRAREALAGRTVPATPECCPA